MNVHLKEDPRAWRTFAVQVTALFGIVTAIAWCRGTIPTSVLVGSLCSLLAIAGVAFARPRWFRMLYRGGMIASGFLGEYVGRAVLTVLFFLVLVPLGLVLRAFSYDPLSLRRRADRASYWKEPSRSGNLDQMF